MAKLRPLAEKIRPLICRSLPRPGRLPVIIPEGLRVLLMSTSLNNVSRRIESELLRLKVSCSSFETTTSDQMVAAVESSQPDVIICPYMVQKVPCDIFCRRTRPCLIVHPGIPGDRSVASLDFAIRDELRSWGVTILQAEDELDFGDIWSTEEFEMPHNTTKTALYNGVVADTAVKCAIDAVSRFVQGYVPVSLLDENFIYPGGLKQMTKRDRTIDWTKPASKAAAVVRMSDTS